MSLFSSLALPSGALIRNRIAKAAMEENMADADHAPSEALLEDNLCAGTDPEAWYPHPGASPAPALGRRRRRTDHYRQRDG